MPQTEFTFHSPAIFAGQTGDVDVSTCVIRGVSLITGDCIAEGHDLHVDGTTVSQLHELAKARGKVPVNLDHGSGIKDMNGYVDGFRMDGDKLRGDWHLLTSHAETPLMLERAQKMPECFGLSVAFKGKGVAVKPGKKAARAEKLLSVDCVTRPAANVGLFSVPNTGTVDIGKNIMDAINQPAGAGAGAANTEPTLQDVMGAIGKISGRLDQFEQVQSQLVDAHNSAIDGRDEEQPSQEEVHAELQRLMNLTDDQLAAEKVSREDVNRAIDEYNAAIENDAGAEEGAAATAAATNAAGAGDAALAGAGAAATTAELKALRKSVIQLRSEIDRDKAKVVQNQENMEFSALEGKMVTLASQRDQAIELAETLVVENEALRVHLRTGTRPTKGSADHSGERFFSANGSGELHEFQKKVKEFVANKTCKTEGEAIVLAVKEHPELHADWLQNQTRTIRA